MTNAASANNGPIISRDRVGEAIAHALSLYVGRGRRYSVKQLSNATGVKDRMIECAKCSPDNTDWRPLPNEALLSIAAFLGADFTNEWLRLAEQGAFELPDEEPDPGTLAADAADDSATVVRAAIDGHFDEQERAELSIVGQRKVMRGKQLIALGGTAAKRRAA